jgi:hypothetical protein
MLGNYFFIKGMLLLLLLYIDSPYLTGDNTH